MSETGPTEILTEESYIQDFYDNVVEYQALLDRTPPDEIDSTLREAIVSELDQICPYAGETVCMNGRGIVPRFDDDGDYESDTVIDTHGDTDFGVHLGMAIVPDYDNKDRLLIMHQVFLHKEHSVLGYTARQSTQFFAFFDINSSITRVEELESVFQHNNPETGGLNPHWDTALENYSNKVFNLLKSTQFRRSNKRGQMAKLQALIYEAEQETTLQDSYMRILAGYGYLLVPTENRKHFVPMDISEDTIDGTCMGFISLDYLQIKNKAIRKDADRPDELAGLCIVLDPSEDTRNRLRLEPNHVLYIPTGQEMACDVQ